MLFFGQVTFDSAIIRIVYYRKIVCFNPQNRLLYLPPQNRLLYAESSAFDRTLRKRFSLFDKSVVVKVAQYHLTDLTSDVVLGMTNAMSHNRTYKYFVK